MEDAVAVVIEPVRLSGTETLYFQSPFVVPFYLLKAAELRDVAEPKRLVAVSETVKTLDGSLRPRDPAVALDAIEDLSLAVILSASAIEAHVNDVIGRLPESAMVEVPTRIAGTTVAVMRDRAAMLRLPMPDKVSKAAPLLSGARQIKGTVAWQHFRHLVRLRNALVHQHRVAVNDPDNPSVFGRLLLGEGNFAPERAVGVIDALEPGWFPPEHRERDFWLTDDDFLVAGGNRGEVAKRLDGALRTTGWREGRYDTHITATLTRMPYRDVGETEPDITSTQVRNEGYKTDNVKQKVALDVE